MLQIAAAPLVAFRHREEAPSFFTSLSPADQADWADNLQARLQSAPQDAPAVCVLDTGVLNSNRLLASSLADTDCDTYDTAWGKDDSHGHGTEIAGLALLGDLTPLLVDSESVTLKHRLESVKNCRYRDRTPRNYTAGLHRKAFRALKSMRHGASAYSVLRSQTRVKIRTAGRPLGLRRLISSVWAWALVRTFLSMMRIKKLFFVSVGNIRDNLRHGEYSARNDVEPVENPAQS